MKKLRKLTLFLLVAITCIVFMQVKVMADNGASHKTYTVDSNGDMIPTQDAYIAVKKVTNITFNNSELLTLNNPEDIYYNSKFKKFYIADTGNARIIQTDATFTNALEIGKGILVKPQGVFASNDGCRRAEEGAGGRGEPGGRQHADRTDRRRRCGENPAGICALP